MDNYYKSNQCCYNSGDTFFNDSVRNHNQSATQRGLLSTTLIDVKISSKAKFDRVSEQVKKNRNQDLPQRKKKLNNKY